MWSRSAVNPRRNQRFATARCSPILLAGGCESYRTTETGPVRQDDGSYLDIWRWESAEAMRGTAAAAKNFALVGATLALTTDHCVLDGEVLDER